jgi:hypothetical protein
MSTDGKCTVEGCINYRWPLELPFRQGQGFYKADSKIQISFGRTTKFGSKNPLPFFNLPQTVSVSPPTNLGIGSVTATLPHATRKSR